MQETKEKLKKVCEMKERITEFTQEAILGDKADVESAGKLIDMIKDLAKVEKNCWEACYYKTIVEAMQEGDDDRAGYDHFRYSSGRFAPKGHGHRSGYSPDRAMADRRMWDETYGGIEGSERLGYPYDHSSDRGAGNQRWGSGMDKNDGRSGNAYDRYRDSRRHYHESHSQSDKEEMSHQAKAYLAESVSTMREIWSDADPEMKKKMKEDLTMLCKEMGI